MNRNSKYSTSYGVTDWGEHFRQRSDMTTEDRAAESTAQAMAQFNGPLTRFIQFEEKLDGTDILEQVIGSVIVIVIGTLFYRATKQHPRS